MPGTPDVVVLAYLPDKAVVDVLVAKLQSLGLVLWADWLVNGGRNLPKDEIRRQVKKAPLTLLCVSAASVALPWYIAEHEICFTTHQEQKERVLQVRLGDLHPNNQPPPARIDDFQFQKLVADAKGSFDKSIDDLCIKVFGILGRKKPMVVTGLIAAITRAEWQGYAGALPGPVSNLCNTFGFTTHGIDLANRYGEHPKDFHPFTANSIAATVETALRESNAHRQTRAQLPILVQWLDPLRFPNDRELRRQWEREDSLLVVDSVSTSHPRVQALLQSLPQHQQPHRLAMLWIPPHTQHSTLHANAFRSVADAPHVIDCFQRWEDGEDGRDERSSFDAMTEPALLGWLHRLFLRAGETRPSPAILQALQDPAAAANPRPPSNFNAFFGDGGGAR